LEDRIFEKKVGVDGCWDAECGVCDNGVTGDFNGDDAVKAGKSDNPKSVFSMVLFNCN